MPDKSRYRKVKSTHTLCCSIHSSIT